MISARYVQYGFGKHRLYYIPEGGGDLAFPPTAHYYCPTCPNSESKMIRTLDHLDTGVYYFEIEFRVQGNYLFIYYEGEQRTGILNAIVRPY